MDEGCCRPTYHVLLNLPAWQMKFLSICSGAYHLRATKITIFPLSYLCAPLLNSKSVKSVSNIDSMLECVIFTAAIHHSDVYQAIEWSAVPIHFRRLRNITVLLALLSANDKSFLRRFTPLDLALRSMNECRGCVFAKVIHSRHVSSRVRLSEVLCMLSSCCKTLCATLRNIEGGHFQSAELTCSMCQNNWEACTMNCQHTRFGMDLKVMPKLKILLQQSAIMYYDCLRFSV